MYNALALDVVSVASGFHLICRAQPARSIGKGCHGTATGGINGRGMYPGTGYTEGNIESSPDSEHPRRHASIPHGMISLRR